MTYFVCKSGCDAGYSMDYRCNHCNSTVIAIDKLSPDDIRHQLTTYRNKIYELENQLKSVNSNTKVLEDLEYQIMMTNRFLKLANSFYDKATTLTIKQIPIYKLDSTLMKTVKEFDDERRNYNP